MGSPRSGGQSFQLSHSDAVSSLSKVISQIKNGSYLALFVSHDPLTLFCTG